MAIIAISTLILDQISKIVVASIVHLNEMVSVIKGFFYITYSENTGAAFSILEGRSMLLIVVSLAVLAVLFRYYKSLKSTILSKISFGLLYGGIVSNLIDRIFLGYVRDFLKFDIFGYHFPIFNIADSAIVIGALLLAICMFRGDDVVENSSRKSRRAS